MARSRNIIGTARPIVELPVRLVAMVFAFCLRILPYFAAFCRGKSFIFFVCNSIRGLIIRRSLVRVQPPPPRLKRKGSKQLLDGLSVCRIRLSFRCHLRSSFRTEGCKNKKDGSADDDSGARDTSRCPQPLPALSSYIKPSARRNSSSLVSPGVHCARPIEALTLSLHSSLPSGIV